MPPVGEALMKTDLLQDHLNAQQPNQRRLHQGRREGWEGAEVMERPEQVEQVEATAGMDVGCEGGGCWFGGSSCG